MAARRGAQKELAAGIEAPQGASAYFIPAGMLSLALDSLLDFAPVLLYHVNHVSRLLCLDRLSLWDFEQTIKLKCVLKLLLKSCIRGELSTILADP